MSRTLITGSKVFAAFILFAALATAGKAGLLDKVGGLDAALDVAKAATVSDADLQASTKQMMDQMDKNNRVAPASDKYGKRLADLTKGLANEDGLKLNFKVYLVKDINAFATPDGSIRFLAGLMDMMTDDELRFIIGHEVAHVKLGHSLKATRTAYLASAAAKAANANSKLSVQQLTELAEKFVNAQFSQSQETDADNYGLAFMKRHKYNQAAAESSLRKLAALDGTADGRSASMLSSHPGSKQRADKIHELLASK
ncbi:MAG: M48 family metalloprotease [Burkholderiales bacterium]|jgi:putative metalloprotease|nr:M48 family metalloprotease [Burkholderiales bacterium]